VRTLGALALAFAVALPAVAGGAGLPLAAAGDPELGRRIYELGLLPSGRPLAGTVLGDVPVAGRAAACASCHRRSGFGESEGGLWVPPVTGRALAAPRRLSDASRGRLLRPLYQEVHTAASRARVHAHPPRPAYDAASLAAALNGGRDPAGRALDSAMPRYRLSDADAGHLAAHLATLGSIPDPGVDAERVRFATVVTPGAEPAERQAMLETIEAYAAWRNRDVAALLARTGHSPWHRDELAVGYRRWEVDVWELAGPPATWEAQLRARARERPAFALLAGLGGGEPWQPVHAFCEAERVPCLFPSTDLPGTDPAPDWSVYLTGGAAAEGAALGAHLAARGDERTRGGAGSGEGDGPGAAAAPARRVVQVTAGEAGRTAAAALRSALGQVEAVRVEDLDLVAAAAPSPAAARSSPGPAETGEQAAAGPAARRAPGVREAAPTPGPREAGRPDALVLWLGEEELARLDPALLAGPVEVYLSARLAGDALPRLRALLGDRLRLVWPYALPGEESPEAFRGRAWLRARGLAATHERLRLATWFALRVADHALRHLVDEHSRAWFLERVEHDAERGLDPGLYPRASLGPGQRYASKGIYVLRPVPPDGALAPAGGWIVP